MVWARLGHWLQVTWELVFRLLNEAVTPSWSFLPELSRRVDMPRHDVINGSIERIDEPSADAVATTPGTVRADKL